MALIQNIENQLIVETKEKKHSDLRAWTYWIEIPVQDFERAKTFYEGIFGMTIQVADFGGFKMGFFPRREVGCALCQGEGYQPGPQGAVVYLDANPDLEEVSDRIEPSGGKILQAKKQISEEHGYMALFLDSEGNRLALYSMR